jgi:hypothetical protein
MAVFAPIPKANDSVATVKNPGLRLSSLAPWRMSCQKSMLQERFYHKKVSSAGPKRHGYKRQKSKLATKTEPRPEGSATTISERSFPVAAQKEVPCA